jgi:hypothetical protein
MDAVDAGLPLPEPPELRVVIVDLVLRGTGLTFRTCA